MNGWQFLQWVIQNGGLGTWLIFIFILLMLAAVFEVAVKQ